MRKMIALFLLFLVVFALGLTACGECEHQWQAADCNTAKTCTLCGATEGASLGHQWRAATCDTAKTCSTCNTTEGAALGHAWKDATCTEAKTCTACKVTEGDPAGHAMQEANYQEPATCANCDHTEGEALAPAYASFPVEVIPVQIGTEYDYQAACYTKKGRTTVGKLTWENYQVFASDETHEAVAGYEWHSVTVKIAFSDKNAQKYGFVVQSALDDYFWVENENGNGYTDQFTVNYHGQLYDQCLMANGYGAVSEWVGDTCTYTAEFAWRVPVGYDAFMILFYNAERNLGDMLESGDETVLAFRFTE